MRKKVISNPKKRVVVTILRDDEAKYVGKARCDDKDEFNVESGKVISLYRAKIKRFRGLISISNEVLRYHEKEALKERNIIAERKASMDKAQADLDAYLLTI